MPKQTSSLIYLAQPYSHPDPQVRVARFKIAECVTAYFLSRHKEHILSPIVHCHRIAALYNLPSDFDFWQNYNFATLRTCSELRVMELPGYENSKGLAAELSFAKSHPRSLSVSYLSFPRIQEICSHMNTNDLGNSISLTYYLENAAIK